MGAGQPLPLNLVQNSPQPCGSSAGCLCQSGSEDGVQPQPHTTLQTLPRAVDVASLAHSPSLIYQKPLCKANSLIVEMEAETSLCFQSNELGPHPVAN